MPTKLTAAVISSSIHIAEALKIPYFRAFTMPWTRTHDYPQACAAARRTIAWRRLTQPLARLCSFMVPQIEMSGSFYYATYVLFDNISACDWTTAAWPALADAP